MTVAELACSLEETDMQRRNGQKVALLPILWADFTTCDSVPSPRWSSATATTVFRMPILPPPTAPKTRFFETFLRKVFRTPLGPRYSVVF